MYIIDRITENYAICESTNDSLIKYVPLKKVFGKIKEGDALSKILGFYVVNKKETLRRAQNIDELLATLYSLEQEPKKEDETNKNEA